MMLKLKPLFHPRFPMIVTSNPSFYFKDSHYSHLRSHSSSSPPRFRICAQNGGNNGSGKDKEPEANRFITDGNGNENENDQKREGWRQGFNIRWRELLNPDSDNFVAIGLAGVLTWASVQVLAQLLFISVAILVAALKYSFIAALLIFILITLL